MQPTSSEKEINDNGASLLDDHVFVPIEPDWRKKYYKNSLKKRAIALILDWFLTYIPAVFLTVIIALVLNIDIDKSAVASVLLQFVCFIVFCAFMESSKHMGTFGKRIMKIQITDKDGHSISFSRSLLRNFLRIIVGYSYILFIPLVIQVFRFRKTRKLFHDELSSTLIGVRLPNRIQQS